MARIDILRPYVEKVVAEYLQIPADKKLVVDSDGDIPIQTGSASYYVRLVDREPPAIQVYSVLLREVPKSPELFEELNSINRDNFFVKLFWVEGDRLIASTEIMADTADKGEIANACSSIAWIADHHDTELQGKFGGKMAGADPQPEVKPGDAPADV